MKPPKARPSSRRGSLPVEQFQKILRVFNHSRDNVNNPAHTYPLDLGDIKRIHSLPYEAFARSATWRSVQTGVIDMFKQEPLTIEDHKELIHNLRCSMEEDIGEYIMEFYQNHLQRRGMQILVTSFDILDAGGEDLLEKLALVWKFFYSDLLPMIELTLAPLQDSTVRLICLTGFRDLVLLRSDIEGCVEFLSTSPNCPDVKQMLLVLHYYRDTTPPSNHYLQLEKLLSRIVTPFQGYQGYYGQLGLLPTLPSPQAVDEQHTTEASPPASQLTKSATTDSLIQGSPTRAKRVEFFFNQKQQPSKEPTLMRIQEHVVGEKKEHVMNGCRERSHSIHCDTFVE